MKQDDAPRRAEVEPPRRRRRPERRSRSVLREIASGDALAGVLAVLSWPSSSAR